MAGQLLDPFSPILPPNIVCQVIIPITVQTVLNFDLPIE